MKAKVKSYIQGLRWSGLKEFLFEASIDYNLELTILHEDKGLLRTTIYFQLEGRVEDLKRCGKVMSQMVEKYNQE